MKTSIFERKGGIFAKGTLKLEDIINAVLKENHEHQIGAIFTFSGIVRSTSLKSDKKVVAIEIEAWEEKATTELDNLCKRLIQKYHLIDLRIYHATGSFKLDEPLVFIVAASSHRNEGHAVLLEAIEEYKHTVAIWKKEIYSDGSSNWISDQPYSPK